MTASAPTLFIGLDLGGTNVRCAVADVGGAGRPDIRGRDERPTPRGSAREIIGALADSARAALADSGAALRDVAAVGCSAPGPLDHRTGVVHEAPNLVGFEELPLAARLSAALDGAAVFLDRDTSAAAIAEGTIGAAAGVRDFVYVTVSTGLGGAIVSGGQMLRGAAGTAGEIGHWPVSIEGDAPRCGCGARGCVEAYAAGRNLAEAYGSDDAEQVYAAARAGEPRAVALIDRAEAALGALAVGLTNVLSPALIVVGGSVTMHQPAHVLEPMRMAIAKRAFRVAAAAVRVEPAALGPDVGLYGAILLASERRAGGGKWSA